MSTIFSKIIKGEIPCHHIYEDNDFFSFLDIRPISVGHTLVIPKLEIDYFFDLDTDLLSKIMPVSQKIAGAIKSVVPCRRVGVMVAGLEVPHAHLHLVPITNQTQLSFAFAKPADNEALAKTAKMIREQLKNNIKK